MTQTTFFQLKNDSERIRLSDIRFSRCIYFMAYALELIFFSVRGQFLPVGFSLFGIKGWTVIHAVHMVASLVVMLLWSDRFLPLLRSSAIVMLVGFLPYIFLPEGLWRFIFGMIGYIGLGGAVTGARCGYAFVANNAERFFSIILMYFSVMVVRYFSCLGADGVVVTKILPITLLVLLSICLFQFREEDFNVKTDAGTKDTKGLYWAFAFFLVYFVFDGYIGELIEWEKQYEYMFMLLGIACSGLLLIAVFCLFRFSTWHLWNLFFFFTIGMGLFAVLAPKIGSLVPQYFFCGMSYMGWPLCLYTLGCAQRRFASYKLLKKCTLIYVVLSPLTTLSSDWFASFVPQYLPHITLCVSLTITIIVFLLSPFSYKHLFSAIWISDIYKPDMGELRAKVEENDRFEKYGLTPRQKEIAVFLLAAKTRRQIAGELGLSESTIKMHTTELYRRLNINSRVELFRLFGVSNEENQTEEGSTETQ